MELVNYIDKFGQKRRGIEKKCIICGKIFITRKDKSGVLCSTECTHEHRRKRVIKKCAWCEKEFSKKASAFRNSKSGLYFCSRDCKDQAQMLGGIEAIMPFHYGSAESTSKSIRRLYKRLFGIEKLFCVRCGYDEFECGIDIHHKNCDRSVNTKENLISLCAPCHRGLHFGFWKFSDLEVL